MGRRGAQHLRSCRDHIDFAESVESVESGEGDRRDMVSLARPARRMVLGARLPYRDCWDGSSALWTVRRASLLPCGLGRRMRPWHSAEPLVSHKTMPRHIPAPDEWKNTQ